MILDTCALLWLSNGEKKPSQNTVKKIGEVPFVYVSAISSFEIGLKSAKGKLIYQNRLSNGFRELWSIIS